MTAVGVTGLAIGFVLGVLVAHEAAKLRRKIARKLRRLAR